jgi:hypothetical protein
MTLLKKIKKLITPSLLVLLLTSCNTTINDFEKYEKSPILQTEFLPENSEIYKDVPTIIFLPFKSSEARANEIGASSILQTRISNILLSNKLVEIYNRSNIEKLTEEIKLAALQNTTNADLKAINFAIEGEVSSVNFSSTYRDKKFDYNGDMISPAKYYYTASANGVIKIFEIPSLKLIDTIPFSGVAYSSEDANQDGISFAKLNIKSTTKAKQFDTGLAQRALKNGINSVEKKIKSVFAKTGYIIEKRVLKDKTIFLITLGSKDGIKQNTKVKIYQKYQDLNPLTQTSEILEKHIGNGVVADKTEPTKTWIVINNTNPNLIKLGDIVKVVY